MKFIKLLVFDIKNGFLKNKLLLLTSIIFPLLFCIDIGRKIYYTQDTASFADYFTYIYGGMKEYIPSPSEPFIFPAVWTVLILALPYAILNYPLKDIQSFGQQSLIRTRSRMDWWFSKCCWNVFSSVGYHLIVITTIILFCVITQTKVHMEINNEILLPVFKIDSTNFIEGNIYLNMKIILVPILISISLNLFQMVLSLFIKPIFSFLTILIIVLSSCYLLTPLLIGNYAMVVRSSTIINNGVDFTVGMFISFGILLLSVIAGAIRFKYYDIINKE